MTGGVAWLASTAMPGFLSVIFGIMAGFSPYVYLYIRRESGSDDAMLSCPMRST